MERRREVWEVPYASYDELQQRWETIEEAAKRNEPEELRKRAEARKGTEEEAHLASLLKASIRCGGTRLAFRQRLVSAFLRGRVTNLSSNKRWVAHGHR